MKEVKVLGVKIQYNNSNVRIINSYKVKSRVYMKMVLQEFLKRTGYKSKRSIKSWLKEWKAHNRLYKLGLYKTHTVDCDLEENEKLHRLIIYEFLGR